jgi:aminopeptidase N
MRSASSASAAFIAASVLLALGPPAEADAYRRQPVDVQHYDVTIVFGEGFDYEATVRLDVRLLSPVDEIHLDLMGPDVLSVTSGGRPLPHRHESGRLVVGLPRVSPDEAVPLTVRYRGRPDGIALLARPNAHGSPGLFADNWPEGARRWLPTVDHPSDKATVDFTVSADTRFRVVAPGRLVDTWRLPDGRRLTHWSMSVPIPTYCMVVGLAEFEVTSIGEAEGIPLSAWVFPADADAIQAVFGRSALMLEYYADLLGPYPYGKLAQVQSSTRYAGMENSSAIFYAEGELHGPDVDEFPVAHEIAHQWWGDSVTPADWDDLWLSEGFATYFDALFYEHVEGPAALRDRLRSGRERILEALKEAPRAVVEPEVENPQHKLTTIVYQKGAWVLHMLRHRMGDEAFFRSMRAYYQRHAGGNVTTADFRRLLEAETGDSLETFLHQWLCRTDIPELAITWMWDTARGDVVVEVKQVQEGEPYQTPLDLTFVCPEGTEARTMTLGAARDVARFRLKDAPSRVDVDREGWLLNRATVTEARTPADRARLGGTAVHGRQSAARNEGR